MTRAEVTKATEQIPVGATTTAARVGYPEYMTALRVTCVGGADHTAPYAARASVGCARVQVCVCRVDAVDHTIRPLCAHVP